MPPHRLLPQTVVIAMAAPLCLPTGAAGQGPVAIRNVTVIPMSGEGPLRGTRRTTPMEALATATRRPAEWLRLADSVGTIEPGKVAD